MTQLTHHCSECGREVGYQDTPYRCPRTGRMAQPHARIARRTPRPPAQHFNGPPLRQLLAEGYSKANRRDRAAAQGSATSRPAAARPTAGEGGNSQQSPSPAHHHPRRG